MKHIFIARTVGSYANNNSWKPVELHQLVSTITNGVGQTEHIQWTFKDGSNLARPTRQAAFPYKMLRKLHPSCCSPFETGKKFQIEWVDKIGFAKITNAERDI
jgi:hypothetical protein